MFLLNFRELLKMFLPSFGLLGIVEAFRTLDILDIRVDHLIFDGSK